MNYTMSRPPNGRTILLDLDRDALAGLTTHPTDCAFVLSALPASAVARHDERGRPVDLAFPIREAALLLRWRGSAGER